MSTTVTATVILGDDSTTILLGADDSDDGNGNDNNGNDNDNNNGSNNNGGTSFVVPCGVRSLGDRHIRSDPPLPEELTNAIGEMMDHLEDAKREVPRLVDASSVSLAGPIPETIVAIEIGATASVPTFTLTRDASEDVFRTVATEASADRRHNPGLPADLVGVIVGGCCAVVGLIRGLHLDSVEVVISTGSTGTTGTTGQGS